MIVTSRTLLKEVILLVREGIRKLKNLKIFPSRIDLKTFERAEDKAMRRNLDDLEGPFFSTGRMSASFKQKGKV